MSYREIKARDMTMTQLITFAVDSNFRFFGLPPSCECGVNLIGMHVHEVLREWDGG